jgi:hypothetical protein
MNEENTFADSDDPEIRDLVRRIEAARRKGLIKDPPRSRKAVRSLEDLCRYVFKLAQLNGDYQMLVENDNIGDPKLFIRRREGLWALPDQATVNNFARGPDIGSPGSLWKAPYDIHFLAFPHRQARSTNDQSRQRL